VLVFFFIVPLFGTILLGMLWKRATPAGGFWGFLSAILVSMWMWGYVHYFPESYRPQPKVTVGQGAIVTLVKGDDGKYSRIVVESGQVDLVNVPVANAGPTLGTTLEVPPTLAENNGSIAVQVLAPEVVLSDSKETTKFGVEA